MAWPSCHDSYGVRTMIVVTIILFNVLLITAITTFWRAYAVRTARGRGLGLGLTAWGSHGEMDAPLDDELADDDHCMPDSTRFIHNDPSDDLNDNYPMGMVNPASGLPMMPGTPIDVAGNPFGTDWSSGASSRFDSGNSFSCGSSDW